MSEGKLLLLPEPPIEFAHGQKLINPQDGLSLFGPYSAGQNYHPTNIAIGAVGTNAGINQLQQWASFIQTGFQSKSKLNELRSWPPFPGFEAAFQSQWFDDAVWSETLDEKTLLDLSENEDPNQRAYEVCNSYLEAIEKRMRGDERVDVIVCVVPDQVKKNCRIQSRVSAKAEGRSSVSKQRIKGRKQGQQEFFGEGFYDSYDQRQYEFSPDFRRQLKARAMKYRIPIQIIMESTLDLVEPVSGARGKKAVPLSYRTWNLATAISYKAGAKPWRLATARDGVCYVGIAFRRDPNGDQRSACCAAQLFLDTGDGVVFQGEYGSWYSPESQQFHLDGQSAEQLLDGVLKTYYGLGGKPLTEIFLHSRSDISQEEFDGYSVACPKNAKLVGVRVQKDREGLRMFRPGEFAVLRGTCWQINDRMGYLWTSGLSSMFVECATRIRSFKFSSLCFAESLSDRKSGLSSLWSVSI